MDRRGASRVSGCDEECNRHELTGDRQPDLEKVRETDEKKTPQKETNNSDLRTSESKFQPHHVKDGIGFDFFVEKNKGTDDNNNNRRIHFLTSFGSVFRSSASSDFHGTDGFWLDDVIAYHTGNHVRVLHWRRCSPCVSWNAYIYYSCVDSLCKRILGACCEVFLFLYFL